MSRTEIITRTETDSFGPLEVPSDKYWGAQTQRSIINFPIGWERQPIAIVRALGVIKKACAQANKASGKLDEARADAIIEAATEVITGALDDNFPLVVWQTGSGTQSNMNANEVIANRAIEILGGEMGSKDPVHPNDHVNMGQSTNDTFPTAIHVAAAREIKNDLLPALTRLQEVLAQKAKEWDQVIKIGRTHLMDATPLRLGQEFGGFARQVELSIGRAKRALEAVLELPVGGTAVGSGINTHPEFGHRVSEELAKETDIAFVEAVDHFEANAQRDGLVECHGQLKTIATTLFNLSNNIRWLGSGPRCGFYEVVLPSRQPGSSIMPGKVNPVMCESMMQLSARVIGNDVTISTCGAGGGQFQLNIMMPVMGHTVLESITLMAAGTRAFIDFCAAGLEANEQGCEAAVEQSLSMVTSLNPHIGYEKASKLAKEAFESGKTIRELCREQGVLPESTLKEALDPLSMTEPQV
jgi:fumarate hydratase class II